MAKIFLTVASIVFLLVFDQFVHVTSMIRGHLDARYDVLHGNYRVLTYGMPGPWRDDWKRLLQDRYQITNEAVAGCLVSDSLIAYVRAYNGVSIISANEKFGHDVFAEISEEARENWRAMNPPPPSAAP